ncbi:MAG: TonB-dependent receptor, partial [Pseudomonadota bacterium]|nr:TonB-dependent receptor [Pseudomonadota bacterium]
MSNVVVLQVVLIGALASGPAWADDAGNDTRPDQDVADSLFAEPVQDSPAAATPAADADADDDETLASIPVRTTPAPPAMGRDDAGAPMQLEEIVVTATKRAASPRELPSSISAVRGQDLEKIGAQGQEDFLKQVPGVTFVNDQITPNRITIRGIGADLNTSNTTGVFLGDVPFEDPTLPRLTLDPNPFDLARVEVLKGPQGTLFGGSALNGAVRYIPEDPSLAGWEGKVYMQVENVFEGGLGTSYGAAVNVPLGDTFALRVVGFDRHSAGWVDDLGRDLEDVNELDQQGGRVTSLWQPNESWKISAMVVAQQTDVADSSITDNRDGNLSRSNTPAASPVSSKYDLETLGIQYSFDSFDVQSQTSRAAKTFNGRVDASRIGNIPNPPPLVTIYNDNESEALMQELRFTSNDGAHPDWKWLGGVFYRKVLMREVSDILASNQQLPIPPALLDALAGLIPGFNGIITEDGRINTARGEADPIDVREAALFGEVTSTFWDAFEVTLGLRAFRNTSDSRVVFSGVLAANLSEPTIERVVEGRIVESGINPKLALKYTFNEHVAIYAAASRGFRFGGAQVLVGTLTSQAPDFYKLDTLWAYEAGLR